MSGGKHINLPFLAGQDESWDSKLLPEGMLRAARDVRMDVNGAIRRRPGTESRPIREGDGDTIKATVQELSPPDYVHLEAESDQRQLLYKAYQHNGNERFAQVGLLPTLSAPSAITNMADIEGIPVKNPQCATAYRGSLLIFTESGGSISSACALELRDPDTLALIKRWDIASANIGRAPVLVASATSHRAAIISRGGTSQLQVNLYETEDDFTVLEEATSLGVTGTSTYLAGASARPDVDSFIVAVPDWDGSNVLIKEVTWDDLDVSDLATWPKATADAALHLLALPKSYGFVIGATESGGGEYASYFDYASGVTVWDHVLSPGVSTTLTTIAHGWSEDFPDRLWRVYSHNGGSGVGANAVIGSLTLSTGADLVETTFESRHATSAPLVIGGWGYVVMEAASINALDAYSGVEVNSELGTHCMLSTAVGGLDRDEGPVDRPMPSPAILAGDTYIFPYEEKIDQRVNYRNSFWSKVPAEQSRGAVTRKGETLLPGGVLHFSDGRGVGMAGFAIGPDIVATSGGAGHSVTAGDYVVGAHLEYVDANGRVWKGQAFTDSVNVLGGQDLAITYNTPNTGPDWGDARTALYMSAADGTDLYRQTTVTGDGTYAISSDPVTDTEQIYTQIGSEVGNDPPPACNLAIMTRSRVWAARGHRLQASKSLREFEGVHWSELDNFFVNLPDKITGLAAIDDSVVAFTRDAIYIIGGDGPAADGTGAFPDPQRIPGNIGCINAKSMLVDSSGVWFQSTRGIEFMSRGFSSPEWVGQKVRDTLDDFPHCWSAAESPEDSTLRWIFGEGEESGQYRIIIFDTRANSWFVWGPGEETSTAGRRILARQRITGSQSSSTSYGTVGERGLQLETATQNPDIDDVPHVTTGSLRLSSLNGWWYGKRVNVLGEFVEDCSVTLEYSFNDTDWREEDAYTWEISSDDYTVGQGVELELTLPVQKFSAVRFRLKIVGGDFVANGLTMYFMPAPGGPRVPAGQKG